MQCYTRRCPAVAALAHFHWSNSVKANDTTTSDGNNYHTVVRNVER